MMKKAIKKGILTIALGLTMVGIVGLPAMAANFNLSGYIKGNMVRLRTEPNNGVVLGLMAADEQILVNSENLDEQYLCGWAHIKRTEGEGAGQIGWADAHFVRCEGIYS